MESSGFHIDLPYEWKAVLSQSLSKDYGSANNGPGINTTALNQVISGTGKPTNVPFFNPFCSDQAGPCNNEVTRAYIQTFNFTTNTNWLEDYALNFDGPLFALPGGEVRLAVGGEYTTQSLSNFNYNNTTAAVGTYIVTGRAKQKRYISSVYGEAYVPVIGAANAMPGIAKLELTGAVRYTTYNAPDVTTTNPKFGLNYSPINDLKLHASYGTSFRAPNLRELNPAAGATITGGTTNLQCGSYPDINIAACPAGGATAISGVYYAGGNTSVRPETGKTWTAGADWSPESIPGLTASATYYNIKYEDTITQPVTNAYSIALINARLYDDLLILNPTYFPARAIVTQTALDWDPSLTRGAPLTQAQYNALVAQIYGSTALFGTIAPAVNPLAFIGNSRFLNAGSIITDGFDFEAQYNFDTPWGAAHVGGTGTYVLNYKAQTIDGAPLVDETNRFGYNVRFRTRLEAGIQNGGWDATLYLNYTNPYSSDPQYVPAAAVAANPAYLNIAANTTFDLSVGYNTGTERSQKLLNNIKLQVSAVNVLDKKPPFFLNAASLPPILFDPNQASALGRVITLRITKEW